MAEFGDQLRFSWTNHATVDDARKALKARREAQGRSSVTEQVADDTARVA